MLTETHPSALVAPPARAGFEPRFVEHRGRRVLRLDFSGLRVAELPPALQQAGDLIAAQPPASLRILTILKSRFDAPAAEALRRYARANKDRVLASAVVVSGFWAVVVTSIKLHERPDLYLFEGEEEALAWLAS